MKYVIGPVKELNEIEVGSIVEPHDGSFSLTLREGVMKHEYLAHTDNREKWEIIVLDGRFPIDLELSKFFTLPYDHNNVMMVSVKDPNKYCFIRLEYLRKV
jgi:hypothetical protein